MLTIPGDPPAPELDARTRLREAALDRFGRKGVHRASTREIIAAAGLRNPSSITYYFGSKAELVADLIREINLEQSAIIQRQIALVGDATPPTQEAWAATAVDAAIGLLSTERGCLLTRVWADQDEANPHAVEDFLVGDHPQARAWRDAVTLTFPDLSESIAIARNVVVLRTLQMITVRRTRRYLGAPAPWWHTDPLKTRSFLLELALNILTPSTNLTDAHFLDL